MVFNPLKYYLQVSELIKRNNQDIDTSVGTFVGDTIVFPMSVLYEKVAQISNLLLKINNLDGLVAAIKDQDFITDVAISLDLTEDEVVYLLSNTLDNIASDYDITRLTSQYAEGIVYFQFKPPTQMKTYIIGSNIRVRSIFNLWYVPIDNFSFVVNPDPNATEFSLVQYYVPELGTYAFPVKVRCEIPGTVGNIDVGQIAFREFGTPTDFLFATNITPISGGRDEETNEELVQRIKTKWKGQNYGTIGGFKNILEKEGYFDVYVSGQRDPYMLRSPDGGAIDIYIRNYTEATVVKTLNLTANTTYIIKNLPEMSSYLPVIRVNIVSGPSNSAVELIKDTSNLYKLSSRANDALRVTESGQYQLQFTYNADIKKLQELFGQDDYHVLGQDVMIRQALPYFIDIQCVVVLYPGTNIAAIEQTIRTTVMTYVHSRPLGSQLSQSDIVNIIEDIDGVNYVQVPFLIFRKANTTSNQDTIILQPIEYFQISTLDIRVQL